MSEVEVEVDGNRFVFPASFEIEVYDEWNFYRKLTAAPLKAAGCDLVALSADTMYLIEAKDYSRPDSKKWPGVGKLADAVTVKGFDTLAGILAAAKSGGMHEAFGQKAVSRERFILCLSVEFPATDRLAQTYRPALKDAIARKAKYLRSQPLVVSNATSGKPWESSRAWR